MNPYLSAAKNSVYFSLLVSFQIVRSSLSYIKYNDHGDSVQEIKRKLKKSGYSCSNQSAIS